MADATTIETLQLVSANNQPNSDSEDASSLGTYGIRPMFQQLSTVIRNESINGEWIDLNGLTGGGWTGGLTPTHISGTSFTYQGNQTAYFTINRRLKAILSLSNIYGYVSTSTYNAGPNSTTVVAVWDSGSLDATETDILVGWNDPTNLSIPTQVIATKSFVNGQSPYTGATSGTNAYTVTLSPVPASLAALQNFPITLFVTNGNTSAANVTLAPNGLTATAVLKWANGTLVQLAPNDIPANGTILVMYDGTEFVLLSSGNQVRQFDGAAGARQLKGSSPGSATTLTLTANLLMLRPNATTGYMILPGFSGGATLDISTAGPALNGRDQAGAFGNNSTVHVHAIGGAGQTTGLLASLSATAPTLPTNYTNFAYLMSFIMATANVPALYIDGNRVFYATAQSVLSAGQSSLEANISLATTVPSNAATVMLQIGPSVTCAANGFNGGTVALRLSTGANFFKASPGIYAAGVQTVENDTALEIPNNIASQNLIYIWTVAPSSAGNNNYGLNVLVLGYTVPNNA